MPPDVGLAGYWFRTTEPIDLEGVMTQEYLSGWKRLMEKLKGSFDQRSESGWQKKAGMDWRQWASLSDED